MALMLAVVLAVAVWALGALQLWSRTCWMGAVLPWLGGRRRVPGPALRRRGVVPFGPFALLAPRALQRPGARDRRAVDAATRHD